MPDVFPRRFLKLDQVADLLATSLAQVYALVRRGELRAINLGVRGQWRVETAEIDRYVEGLYEETRQWIEAHPFTDNGEEGASDAALPDV